MGRTSQTANGTIEEQFLAETAGECTPLSHKTKKKALREEKRSMMLYFLILSLIILTSPNVASDIFTRAKTGKDKVRRLAIKVAHAVCGALLWGLVLRCVGLNLAPLTYILG